MTPGRARAPAEAIRLLVVLWASVGAIQPLLAPGLPTSHDAEGHLYRLFDFDLTFRSGDLFPRIAPHLAQDYGYATFTFYSPAALYLGEAFRLTGLGYITSLKACFALSLVAAGFGVYLLGRDLYGWRGGILAALVYVYVPYHLLDVYTRGDLSEALGMALLPGVFWSMWRVARSPRATSVALAGAALALLITTHNITAFFALPLVLAFLVVVENRALTKRSLLGIIAAGAVSAVLSAWYWVPVLSETSGINMVALTQGFFDYHQHFFPIDQLVQQTWSYNYTFAPEAGIEFNLSLVQLVLVLAATAWLILARPARRGVLFGVVVGIAALLELEQASSVWIWDHVPFVRFLQFPYRLSIYVSLLSALLIGGFVAHPIGPGFTIRNGAIARVWPRYAGIVLSCAALVFLIWAALWHIPSARGLTDETQVNLPTLWRLERDRELVAAATQADYLPIWTSASIFSSPPTSTASGLSREPATARITARRIDPLNLDASIDADRPTTIVFDKIYYPSWQASLDGQPIGLAPAGPLGLVHVQIPARRHDLRLADDGVPVERVASIVMLAGVLALLLIGVGPWRRGWVWRGVGAIVLGAAVSASVWSWVQPPKLVAGGVDFATSVRLVGATINPTPDPSGAIDVTFLWEPLATPLADCIVHVRLLDSQGQVAARRDKIPLFGLRPCSQWQQNEVVRDEEFIRLPAGSVPGDFQLVVGLSANGQDVAPISPSHTTSWQDPDRPNGQATSGLELGTVFAATPIGGTLAPAVDPPVANFAGVISLDGAGVTTTSAQGETRTSPSDSRFIARIAPGDVLSIDLFWRSLLDVSDDYSVFTHLVSADNKLIAQDDAWPDRFNFPTSVWFPGDHRHDTYKIVTQPTLPPGVYSLVTGMYERPDFKQLPVVGGAPSQDQVALGVVKVQAPDQIYGSQVPLTPRDDDFGAVISLLGAELSSPTSRPAGTLSVGLAWRAIAQPLTDYTEFVHLLNADGKVAAQHDQPPTNGSYPTMMWDAGDTVYDRVDVPLPSNMPAGRYQVETGLYRLDTGARLTLPSGHSSALIGTVTIE